MDDRSCLTCRFRIFRVAIVAGKRTEAPGCFKWSGYFPESGCFCPCYEREPGSDDE